MKKSPPSPKVSATKKRAAPTKKATIKNEIISIHQLSKIAMVLWIGGSWVTGLVVFPILFRTIDQITAANIVGQVLNILAYMGLICLFLALIEVIINHKLKLIKTKRFWYILVMAFILIINYFAIFPIVYRLRQNLSNLAHSVIALQNNVFDFWHSLSAILFLLNCAIGVLYLLEM